MQALLLSAPAESADLVRPDRRHASGNLAFGRLRFDQIVEHLVWNLIDQPGAEQRGRVSLGSNQPNVIAFFCERQRVVSELLLKVFSLEWIRLERDVLAAERRLELEISLARAESVQQDGGHDAIVVADKRRMQPAQRNEEQLLFRPASARFELRTEQADVEFDVAAAAERPLTMARRTRNVVEQWPQPVAAARLLRVHCELLEEQLLTPSICLVGMSAAIDRGDRPD